MHARVKAKAEKAGMSISELIRMLLAKYLKQK